MSTDAAHAALVKPMPSRWVPALGGVIMNMAIGTLYAVSVFLLPLEKEFGWIRSETSWVTTIAIVMIASWYIIAGKLYDRKGPRLVAVIGGVLFSLGYLLASRIHSLLSFYLTIGVLVGIGNGFCYVVPTSVACKWFPDKRGLIVGLMIGSYGAGSGILGPLALSLIEHFGWRATFQIFALLFFIMTMLAAFLLRDPPPGYQPPNWRPTRAGARSSATHNVPARQMVRTSTFKSLWIAYCLGTAAGVMVISQLVPFARAAGHNAAVAALALTIGAIGNASGRIFSGWMSDHAGRLNTIRVVLLISVIAMPALYLLRQQVVPFYILLCVIYYCYGTQLSVYASTSADFYGTQNVGFNYGLLFTGFGLAGVLGPFLGGRVYVATGEYRWAFFIAAGLALVALAVLSLQTIPEDPRPLPWMRRTKSQSA